MVGTLLGIWRAIPKLFIGLLAFGQMLMIMLGGKVIPDADTISRGKVILLEMKLTGLPLVTLAFVVCLLAASAGLAVLHTLVTVLGEFIRGVREILPVRWIISRSTIARNIVLSAQHVAFKLYREHKDYVMNHFRLRIQSDNILSISKKKIDAFLLDLDRHTQSISEYDFALAIAHERMLTQEQVRVLNQQSDVQTAAYGCVVFAFAPVVFFVTFSSINLWWLLCSFVAAASGASLWYRRKVYFAWVALSMFLEVYAVTELADIADREASLAP